jgi:hypothetical protein
MIIRYGRSIPERRKQTCLCHLVEDVLQGVDLQDEEVGRQEIPLIEAPGCV